MVIAVYFLLVWMLLMPGPARAAPAKAPTLADALVALPPPTGSVLTVGADKAALAEGQALPPAGAALADIAAAFDRQTQDFGAVTALAPLTTVVLNENPDPPDVTADLNAMTAFKVLAASLSDAQWQALTSEQGLGLPDLTDEMQQKLFQALFRRGHLWVASEDPALAGLPDAQRTDIRDFSDQIDSVRIRLGQSAKIYLHDHAGKTIFFSGGSPDAAQHLHTWSPKQDPPAALHSVVLRATVPNVAKDSDLDYEGDTLHVSVPLAGLQTVDDLVARIAALTRLELYADPHYGHRTVTVLGTNASAPAADLLRALALCVCGTYRRVGPAYVLTDDLVGVGTRRRRLQEWEEEANANSGQLGDQAGLGLLERRSAGARTLPAFGDPLALTTDQMARLGDDPTLPGVPNSGQPPPIPFAKLSGTQQGWARRIAEIYSSLRDKNGLPDYLTVDGTQDPDLSGLVTLTPETKVQFLVPALGTPVDTNLQYPMFMLFWPGTAAAEANQTVAQLPPTPKPPAPPLATVLHSRPRRAVIGHPRTAQDVDALVTAMRRLGLNELWLDVFSQGKSHLSDSGGTPDILTEALAKTRGTGIAVYADLSLLAWGAAPPEADQDLTVEGQTSREAATDAHDRQPEPDFDDAGKPIAFVPPPVTVSPIKPAVPDILVSLVQAMAARPGLAGFVWEDAGVDDALGYTPAMRLAFLRACHADPLDITLTGLYLQADVSLPGFDDLVLDKTMPDLWTKARTDAVRGLLTRMRQVTLNVPVLMEQSAVNTNWLTSWDDPRQLPPPLRPLFTDWPYPAPEKLLAVARTQGRSVLLREAVPDAVDAKSLARSLDADLRSGQQATLPNVHWDGFVLDFAAEGATQGATPLAGLTPSAPGAFPQTGS